MNKVITSMICVFTISTASCSTTEVFNPYPEDSGAIPSTAIPQPPTCKNLSASQKELFNQIARKFSVIFYEGREFGSLRPFLVYTQALTINMLKLWQGIKIEALAHYISNRITNIILQNNLTSYDTYVNSYHEYDVLLKTITELLVTQANKSDSLNNLISFLADYITAHAPLRSPELITAENDIEKEKIRMLLTFYFTCINFNKHITALLDNTLISNDTKKNEILNLFISFSKFFSPLYISDESVPLHQINRYKFKNPLIGMHQLACLLVRAQSSSTVMRDFAQGEKSLPANILSVISSMPRSYTPSLLSQLFKENPEKTNKTLIKLILNYIFSTEAWDALNITQECELQFLMEDIVGRNGAFLREDKQISKIEDEYIAPYIALLAGKTYDQLPEVERDLGTIKKSAEERTSFPIKRPVSDIGNIEDPRNPKRNESNRRMHLIEHEMNSDEHEDPLPSDSTKPIVFPQKYNTYDDLPKLEDPFDLPPNTDRDRNNHPRPPNLNSNADLSDYAILYSLLPYA